MSHGKHMKKHLLLKPDQSPVSPLMVAADVAFRRDLPKLLETRKRQWAAYHGRDTENPIFANSKEEIYDECRRRGYDRRGFLVRRITPESLVDRWIEASIDI